MKVKVLVALLVFLVALNLAAVSAFLYFGNRPLHGRYWGGPGGGPPGGGPSGMELLGNMDREDREQLRELALAFHESTIDLRERSRELEDEVFELMREGDVDRARVDSLVAQISDLRLEIGTLAIDHLIEAKAFLSPDQQEVFHNMILRRMHGRQGRPGFDRRKGPWGRDEK